MHKYSCTITTNQDGWETNMEDGNRQLTAYEEELTFTKRNKKQSPFEQMLLYHKHKQGHSLQSNNCKNKHI